MDIAKLLEKFTEAWQIKLILAGILSFCFGEFDMGMQSVLGLVMLDSLTRIWVLSKKAGGLWSAWKTDAISSWGMQLLIPKACWYMAIIILSHHIGHFSLFNNVFGFTPVELTCSYLALIEAKSILENLKETGMKNLSPIIKMLSSGQKKFNDKVGGK